MANEGTATTEAQMKVRAEPYRLEWLTRTGLLDRKVLFLDLNFWIRITEQEEKGFQELANLIADRVASGLLICPLSPTLMMELEKQAPGERRGVHADVMQTLSHGLALRAYPLVVEAEYRRVVLGKPIDRSLAFSCLWDACLSQPEQSTYLDFTGTGMTDEQIQTIAAQWFDALAALPLRRMLESQGFVDSRARRLAELLTNLQETSSEERLARSGKSRASILQAEFEGAYRSVRRSLVIAILDMLYLGTLGDVALQPNGNPESLRRVLDRCPAFWCHYHLNSAIRTCGTKQLEPNDLWDVQHLKVALPYSDCVATDDRMRHLCQAELKATKRFGTTLVSKPAELHEWLLSLAC